MLRTRLTIAVLALLGSALPASAQTVPFGKNKIQYREFQWRILAGEHIDVYFYPEEEVIARLALAYAEESYRVLERRFRHHPFERIPLIVYSSHQYFEQTNVLPGFISEGVLGVTEYLKRRIALPFRGDYAQFRHTLRHELVHAFQLSKITETNTLHPGRHSASPQQVHWWTEGLAEYWSSEQTPEDAMFIRDMVLTGRVPGLREFTHMVGFASYPLGAELLGYLARRFGEDYIVRVYEEFWRYDSFEETLEAVLDVDLDRLDREWKYALQQRYFPVYGVRSPPEVAAVPLIFGPGGSYKPAIHVGSADSVPQLFFLSGRSGRFGLYRTPLDRGERGVECILEGGRSAEFESFHAYESRIDVNRDGVLAFVSKYLERDALFLWDVRRRSVIGRYQWPDLVGLKSPAWDPTGSRIVFEGLSTSGFSDLYMIDFHTQQRSRLTADRYRDEDPDWSPDGRTIVFASDRTIFGSDGYTNLFLYDVASGDVRYLTYGAWNDVDPRWSHDGGRIAFSSDRAGVADLYAVDPTGDGRRLTAMTGGAFDPAWLPGDAGLVFSGFSDGTFRIYRYTFSEDTLAYPTISLAHADTLRFAGAPGPAARTAATGRPTGWVWEELDAPALAAAEVHPYDSWRRISLDFAGGDALAAPGVGAAQGAQFLATDMLGDHVFFGGVSAIQASDITELIDRFSGSLLYLNLSRRLNFGIGAFRFNGLFRDIDLDLYEEEAYGGYMVASYPFSKFDRIEVRLGIERSDRRDAVGSDAEPFDPFVEPAASRDLTRKGIVASNFVAYVKDNTLWTATGPIAGSRYNLTAGFLTCYACYAPGPGGTVRRPASAESYILSADYRRYFRTSRLTAYAVRAYGFYSDGTIPGHAALGGPHRLRGYPRFSLAGSRVGLLNQEWRFPILHGARLAFPFGDLRLPGIEGALFADIGASWLEHQALRGALGSYGIGLRTPILPPLVLRLDIGRRFRIGTPPPVFLDGDEAFHDTFVDFFFGYNY
ncbi:MAG TPA: hypothetical protein VF188_04470 [Longimicrobiales bacterium]